MSTPEGRVKVQIKAVLKKHGAYWHMPVQNGMGAPALDFMNVLCNGYPCTIEAKAPGEVLTKRQEITKRDIEAAGGLVFVIDGSTQELEQWLVKVKGLPLGRWLVG